MNMEDVGYGGAKLRRRLEDPIMDANERLEWRTRMADGEVVGCGRRACIEHRSQ